jgi:uncharacterized protein (TIGR03067 family)
MPYQRPRCACVAAVLVAALASGVAPTPKPKARPDPVKEELKRLEGEWQLVSYSNNEKMVDAEPGNGLGWTFKGDRVAYLDDDGVTRHYAITLYPSKSPAAMDLKGHRERELHLCVYKLEGNKLTVASGRRRPGDFDPQKSVVCVYERRKKQP